MKSYGPEIREAALRRILPPNSESITSVARELGITPQTLINWKKRAACGGTVNLDSVDDSSPLTSTEKFEVVLATAAMNETQIGEYAREKGIFVEQINNWRYICQQANANFGQVYSQFNDRIRGLEDKIKSLESELAKKDKALAELAAEIVLRKKSWAIWGEKKDE